jgi:hypothetical protein
MAFCPIFKDSNSSTWIKCLISQGPLTVASFDEASSTHPDCPHATAFGTTEDNRASNSKATNENFTGKCAPFLLSEGDAFKAPNSGKLRHSS